VSVDPAIRRPAVWNKAPLEGVRKIIVVASGKGGVGKSTTAVNLALALAAQGKRIGLLDADIYGPSIPHMMHIFARPEYRDGKMTPLENYGVRCMSIGFIIDQAAILRGPMITKTLNQLLRLTRWGTEAEPLDVLFVDMPPGTGDIHLSMVQQAPVDGAIIVTTPQQVATIDARKCATMFQKVSVPILGVIENMSGDLFGIGGGKKLAEELSVPYLGNIPMDAAIREATDAGEAYVGVQSKVYTQIISQLRY
jgi:ATP-binding protein involved in chromosome partitioning